MTVSQLLQGLQIYVTALQLFTTDVILFIRIKLRWQQGLATVPNSRNMLPILHVISMSTALAVSTANCQEESLFEDDIILTRAQEAALEKGHGEDDINRSTGLHTEFIVKWPRNTVNYYISSVFSELDKQNIRSTLKNLEAKLDSCVKFRESRSGHFVHVVNGTGCHSSVGVKGYYGRAQELSLQIPNCLYHGIVEHEFLHAVGLFHQQNRDDRDKYVEILKENIWENMTERQVRVNFDSLSDYDERYHFNLPYDFGSIMHYGSKYYSKNGERTIRTKDPSKQSLIGQRDRASDGDIQQVKLFYGCIKLGKPEPTKPSMCSYTDKAWNCKMYKSVCNWQAVRFVCPETCFCSKV